MGEQAIHSQSDRQKRAKFSRHLIDDIHALELMIDKGLFEDDITRIGAEQEFCLVTDHWRPARDGEKLLELLDDAHFTNELARYNLEINLDPFVLQPGCFETMSDQLHGFLTKARTAAHSRNLKIILTGILPTISKDELSLDYMTPQPRYWNINDMTRQIRGTDFELRLRGVDEISVTHDSVLMEACNTSFQMHLQIPSSDFVRNYNWAQAIAGPVLGICANSPLLLGRELWSETRIALFQQSIDTRTSSYALRDQQSRVTFGDQWISSTAAEIFKTDLAQYKVFLSSDVDVFSTEQLAEGHIPKLQALCLHNSTIYRWNRPCYGILNGKPHLRIENRYLPAGPTVADQIANFVFWVGLMMGRDKKYDRIEEFMDFREAKGNFIRAARTGKESVLRWNGHQISVRDLIASEFLPMAYKGLTRVGFKKEDIEKYLQIIAARNRSFTGAQWQVNNYRRLRKSLKPDDALRALTHAIHDFQQQDTPVHQWPDLSETARPDTSSTLVGHIMSTRLVTVSQHDLAEYATSIMAWRKINHLPVEDDSGQLCGLLTRTHLDRYKEKIGLDADSIVGDIMTRAIYTITPDITIQEAIRIMKQNEYGCMPVVHGHTLVGIITITDVLPFDHD